MPKLSNFLTLHNKGLRYQREDTVGPRYSRTQKPGENRE